MNVPVVDRYAIAAKRGRYLVQYKCPHCRSPLRSNESEVGTADECPECGGKFAVSPKALKDIAAHRDQQEAQTTQCVVCGTVGTLLKPLKQRRDGLYYCGPHHREQSQRELQKEVALERKAAQDAQLREAEEKAEAERKLRSVIVTTAHSVEGYRVVEYLGVDGVEYVTGTGPISEIVGEISDLFGRRSAIFESKLRQGRLCALTMFRQLALEYAANAIIAIDFDYTEFASNRTAIIVTGTLVRVESLSGAQ